MAYVKQKLFKLKEDITVFENASQTTPIYKIKANQWIDWSASYILSDAAGHELGRMGRKGGRSLWKATYEIFDANNTKEFKIEEDRQKNEVPKAELDKVSMFLKSGNGKRWLDNAMIWIYRNHFTYSELKKLVKFYKTSAGQKMATELPLIMVKSLKAGEMIKEFYPK